MSIKGIGSQSALMVQPLFDMRRQLDDLQKQLGTGKKADDYAGLGLDRGLTVGLRTQLSAIEGYDDTIANIGLRTELAQSSLTRMAAIGREVKSAAFQSSTGGVSVSHETAYAALGEMIGLLNVQAGDRYLFSGLATDTPSVASLEQLLDGDGTRAGLKQIISERQQADLGASGLGRLVVSAPAPGTVALAEDVAGSPFGFKLASVSSTLTGATASGPAGSPAGISVALGANPVAGETIQFRFDLPDGSRETVTLTATASSPPGKNEFTIGANASATATNLQAALTGAVTVLADTALMAASAVAASDDFFAPGGAQPPQRVAGPPFATATSLVAGTSSDTVSWYGGEAGSDPARGTATARIDPAITVSYGLRANEEALRHSMRNVAVLAAVNFSSADPNAAARVEALNSRVGTALDGAPGTQSIETIQAELAGTQASIAAASTRHRQTASMVNDMLEHLEGAPTDEIAVKMLALQTRLQASLQTTAMLYQMSLAKLL